MGHFCDSGTPGAPRSKLRECIRRESSHRRGWWESVAPLRAWRLGPARLLLHEPLEHANRRSGASRQANRSSPPTLLWSLSNERTDVAVPPVRRTGPTCLPLDGASRASDLAWQRLPSGDPVHALRPVGKASVLAALHHLVDEAVLDRLGRRQDLVPLGVEVDLLLGLAGVLGQDLVDLVAQLQQLAGVDLDVGRPARPSRTSRAGGSGRGCSAGPSACRPCPPPAARRPSTPPGRRRGSRRRA